MLSFDDRLGGMTIVGLFVGSILFAEPGAYDPVTRSVRQSAHGAVSFVKDVKQDVNEFRRNYDRLMRMVEDNRRAIRELSLAFSR
ncbi:hypothetical protein [Breoghania sp.]|uniref:hypothetical protein n=1 Tax=Breoghania sp. TaxID=2065378 RepID=UPI002AA7D985|nr:hypothetical protein [Breoghania sp.]